MRPICPPDHGHAASQTCYSAHRCGCDECRVNHSAYLANARKLIAYGRWERGRMQPEPIADHVRHLMAFGYSYRQIAAAAGVNMKTPYMLVHGRLRFVFGRVGRAILAVQPSIDDLAPNTIIPARGARRRLQALASRGWTMQAIATHMGRTRLSVSRLLWAENLSVANHRLIAAAYEQLWNTLPAPGVHVARTIRRADELGWLPPLAWDDIDNDPTPPAIDVDDETEVVDVIAIDLVVDRAEKVALTTEERRIVTERLIHMTDPNTGRPYTSDRIAELTGVTSKTIERDRAHTRAVAA